jgi:hypothetical protein
LAQGRQLPGEPGKDRNNHGVIRMRDKQKPPAERADAAKQDKASPAEQKDKAKTDKPKEFGGPKGPEPTRYGDWERKGIVSDF